jgi:heme a synthase
VTALRRLAVLALACTFVQTAVGAIVRISGSGMGCGEHWPDCNGAWLPALTDYRVVIEVTHRYLAVGAVVASTLALVALAVARRRSPGVGGPGGVLRPAAWALGLEVAAALVGSAVVLMSLSNRYVIVVHYTIAMATLAALAVAAQRAGGLGAASVRVGDASAATYRAARAGAVLALVIVVFGALTANVPGAATSCLGFPWCRLGITTGQIGTGGGDTYWLLRPVLALAIQLVHRLLAVLLALHLLGLAIAVTKRREARPIVRAAYVALGGVVIQLGVAAAMVELRLPPVLQSLHQVTGTFLWVSAFAFAALARRALPGALGTVPASFPATAGAAA